MDEQLPKKKDSHSNEASPFSHIFQDRPFRNILETIDQFFQNSNLKPGFKVNVQEDVGKYIIYAELPGVKKNQIDIHILERSITITVNRSESETIQNDKAKSYTKIHEYEKASRTIPFYHPIHSKNAKAKYRDGLLTIILPKKSGKKLNLED